MLAVKVLAECRFIFLQIIVWVFEFQTNFGFRTTSCRFTVAFLISKLLYGVIQGFRNPASIELTLLS